MVMIDQPFRKGGFEMSCPHLNRDDRIRLDVLLWSGLSIKDCAKGIGFSRQAVNNEIKRFSGRKHYNPYFADRKAKEKRHTANQCHRKFSPDNWHTRVTIRLLGIGWSPEQIVGRIELEHFERPFCLATIYNNANKDQEISKLLPRKHNKYRRRKDGNDRKNQREEISNMKSIEIRPKDIELRTELGHWEGDTIIGKERTARILTHTERKTGYLVADLLKEVSSQIVRQQTIKKFKYLPKNKVKTFTYDRGTEFADFELVERELDISTYFANAYHSWERGTSENTNGLVRRYFPKGTYFSKIKREHLKEVVGQINHRPRKRLGYRSPYEKFFSVKIRTLM
jgi:IS30 family transposase